MSAYLYVAAVLLSGVAFAVFVARLALAGRSDPRFNPRLAQAWVSLAALVTVSLPVASSFGAPHFAIVAALTITAGLGAPVQWLTVNRRGPAAAGIIGVMVCLLAVAALNGREWWRQEFGLPAGENCSVLERLEVRNAAWDAARDARRGDEHLVGVYGYTIDLPGVAQGQGERLPSNYRVQVLPCTSDGIVSRRHGLLNDKARAYAAAYNQAALSAPGAPQPKYEGKGGN